LYDDLPGGGSEYNMRQLEIQCANQNGVLNLDDWYAIPMKMRAWKVAAMIVPNILAMLEQRSQAASMNLSRARATPKGR
jgi:hypothetical protein